jgi:hypothetical protein
MKIDTTMKMLGRFAGIISVSGALTIYLMPEAASVMGLYEIVPAAVSATISAYGIISIKKRT